MPTSGQMESLIRPLGANLHWLSGALIDDLSIVYDHYAPSWSRPVTGFVLCALIASWLWILRRPSISKWIVAHYDLRPLLPLAWFGAVLMVYYVCFFGAPYMLDRSMTSVRILAIII